jgi:hypothetical protein
MALGVTEEELSPTIMRRKLWGLLWTRLNARPRGQFA